MKTLCCKADTKRIGRANYICSTCKTDVSLQVMLWEDAMIKIEEINNQKVPKYHEQEQRS